MVNVEEWNNCPKEASKRVSLIVEESCFVTTATHLEARNPSNDARSFVAIKISCYNIWAIMTFIHCPQHVGNNP